MAAATATATATAVVTLILALTTITTAVACQSSGARPRLALDEQGAPHELYRACALAEQRCSRCHTLERVAHAEVASPSQWRDQVERMRRMSGSAISRRDGQVITRCLVYRSFGPAGLEKGFP